MSTQRHGYWQLAAVAFSLSHSLGVSALAFPQDATTTEVVASATATATAPPFPYETVILTDQDVQDHPELDFDDVIYADLDSVNTVERRGLFSKTCKVIPSDRSWPGSLVWGLVDVLTGGGLIKTVPLAAPCYKGQYYNAAKCASITANWTDSDLQYVTLIINPVDFETLTSGMYNIVIRTPHRSCLPSSRVFHVFRLPTPREHARSEDTLTMS